MTSAALENNRNKRTKRLKRIWRYTLIVFSESCSSIQLVTEPVLRHRSLYSSFPLILQLESLGSSPSLRVLSNTMGRLTQSSLELHVLFISFRKIMLFTPGIFLNHFFESTFFFCSLINRKCDSQHFITNILMLLFLSTFQNFSTRLTNF